MVGSGRLETPYLEGRVIRRKCEEYLARTISGEPWLSVLIKPESLPISYPASPPLKGVCFNLPSPIRAFAPQRSIFLLRREIARSIVAIPRCPRRADIGERQREDDRRSSR